jgi:G3E family GTPase
MSKDKSVLMKTPVSIITGYLGSGKTTLLRHIIANSDRKIAILMNEFGKIGIDGAILKGRAIDMIELTGGCVCCSMTGEFQAAIREIREKINPELIVVETTGVAEPDALVGDMLENLEDVRLDSVVTIVDADSMIRFPSLGYTGKIQIEMADILIINKIDLVTADQMRQIRQKLEDLNSRALKLEAVRCNINVSIILDTKPVEKNVRTNHDHKRSRTDNIESFFFSSQKPMSREKLEEFLSSLPPEIIRIKGFVLTEGGSFLVNSVFGRFEFEEFPADSTEIVFIGKDALLYMKSILKELSLCQIGA